MVDGVRVDALEAHSRSVADLDIAAEVWGEVR
jgi:hypothetical protein